MFVLPSLSTRSTDRKRLLEDVSRLVHGHVLESYRTQGYCQISLYGASSSPVSLFVIS